MKYFTKLNLLSPNLSESAEEQIVNTVYLDTKIPLGFQEYLQTEFFLTQLLQYLSKKQRGKV